MYILSARFGCVHTINRDLVVNSMMSSGAGNLIVGASLIRHSRVTTVIVIPTAIVIRTVIVIPTVIVIIITIA